VSFYALRKASGLKTGVGLLVAGGVAQALAAKYKIPDFSDSLERGGIYAQVFGLFAAGGRLIPGAGQAIEHLTGRETAKLREEVHQLREQHHRAGSDPAPEVITDVVPKSSKD
jgi:hypothetical protein